MQFSLFESILDEYSQIVRFPYWRLLQPELEPSGKITPFKEMYKNRNLFKNVNSTHTLPYWRVPAVITFARENIRIGMNVVIRLLWFDKSCEIEYEMCYIRAEFMRRSLSTIYCGTNGWISNGRNGTLPILFTTSWKHRAGRLMPPMTYDCVNFVRICTRFAEHWGSWHWLRFAEKER